MVSEDIYSDGRYMHTLNIEDLVGSDYITLGQIKCIQ